MMEPRAGFESDLVWLDMAEKRLSRNFDLTHSNVVKKI
jgi:hypothetical protein